VYTGGESGGEKVREVTLEEAGEGGLRCVGLNRSPLSQSPGDVTPSWPSDWLPVIRQAYFPFG